MLPAAHRGVPKHTTPHHNLTSPPSTLLFFFLSLSLPPSLPLPSPSPTQSTATGSVLLSTPSRRCINARLYIHHYRQKHKRLVAFPFLDSSQGSLIQAPIVSASSPIAAAGPFCASRTTEPLSAHRPSFKTRIFSLPLLLPLVLCPPAIDLARRRDPPPAF